MSSLVNVMHMEEKLLSIISCACYVCGGRPRNKATVLLAFKLQSYLLETSFPIGMLNMKSVLYIAGIA